VRYSEESKSPRTVIDAVAVAIDRSARRSFTVTW
jgi:hypothetical protein